MAIAVQYEVMTTGIKPLSKVVGGNIRKLIKDRWDGSQEELAAKLGIHQTHVSSIMRGAKLPSLPLAVEIAITLDTNLDFIVGLSNDDAPHADLEDQVVAGVRNAEERQVMQDLVDYLAPAWKA